MLAEGGRGIFRYPFAEKFSLGLLLVAFIGVLLIYPIGTMETALAGLLMRMIYQA